MAPQTVGCLRVRPCQRFTSQEIDLAANQFEVVDVHARAIPAQVIRFYPTRDWSAEHLVGKPVCLDHLAIVLEPAISVDTGTLPIPANTEPWAIPRKRTIEVHLVNKLPGE